MTSNNHRPIEKVLVANRGEIAVRVMRTCRAMGIATVAVHSDADERMPFVEMADEAVRIGPAPAAESYLVIDKILAAARLVGADAIHPGYGFLSENASFARACTEAGITFIGPSPLVIGLLGSKREAKLRANGAGVPIVPGYNGDVQEVDALAARARDIGFPLLVKASAGGGGKGMRIVRSAAEIAPALESAKREAASAFGDDTLILERYVERPRHVEIQILGDHHGNLIHLWERECSIQRRHQKVIEEAPSPALDEARRSSMGGAAVAVGRAVGYTSAGTVEFIVAPDGAFYFLEVNTRLQVEHPVTECITGLDLVREQIRIARGETLTENAAPPIRGHAIEVRLYAEDADNGYLPTTGHIADWSIPETPGAAGFAGIRVDAGVRTGTDVGIHYDPMLAKVIAHAPTRAEAAQLLRATLERASVAGLITNRLFLARILGHPDFIAGALDTHFLERHATALAATAPTDSDLSIAAIAATLAGFAARRAASPLLPDLEPGFRNVRFSDSQLTFTHGDRSIPVTYRNLGHSRLSLSILSTTHTVDLISSSPSSVSFADSSGLRRTLRVIPLGNTRWQISWPGTELTLVELPRFPDSATETVAGGCIAPMPGKVVKVLVSEGDTVTLGQTLLVLEAMKMEHAVKALTPGTLTRLAVSPGDQVDTGALLAIVT